MAGGTIVGLDIGSNMIKIVEMRRGGGIDVTAVGLAPTPVEAVDNGIIIDPQTMGQAVKTLMREAGVTARRVISSVAGQSAVVVRVIEVPPLDDNDLAETMKWEVSKQVPFAVDEVIMDYAPIEREDAPADGQNRDVLLAVAQQDMIDRHVQMLQAAGLKPDAIDVEPLAVGRALLDADFSDKPQGHTVAIVNIGAVNTDINIFRDKLIAFPRALPLAGDNLTRAISEMLQVDMETAENYKREHGEVLMGQFQQASQDFGLGGGGGAAPDGGGFFDFTAPPPPTEATSEVPSGRISDTSSPSGRMPFDFTTPGEEPPPASAPAEPTASAPPPEQPVTPNLPAVSNAANDALRIQVFNAMAPVLTELAQEIRRSLDYYLGRATDAQVHEILLVGGTAKLKNLAPFLEAELGISTRVANPLHYTQVTSKNFSQEHLAEIGPMFAVSIGLGERELIAEPAKSKKKK